MGMICISRRTLVQDLARRHVVLIDGDHRGHLWAFQTGRYPVTPGHHTVRLAPTEAVDGAPGRASSANVDVDVLPGETRYLRTSGRGWWSYMPSLRPFRLISPGMYRRPWIILKLRERT